MIGTIEISLADRENWLLKEYELSSQQVEAFGRVTKVVSAKGTYALKRTKASIEQLERIHLYFQMLQNKGYKHILPFIPTKYGEHFLQYGDYRYYLSLWIDDRQEDKYLENWEEQVLQILAELHQHTENIPLLRDKELSVQGIEQRWQQRLSKLKKLQKLTASRNLLSPIENHFLQAYPFLEKQAQHAIRTLQVWKEKTEISSLRTVLCHGHVFRAHLLHTANHIYLLRFDQASMDTPAKDLALFFRRHMEKASPNQQGMVEAASRWLRVYEQHFPLEQGEKLLLAIYLLFPEQIIRELEIYYQDVRSWQPLQSARYFERQLLLIKAMRQFAGQILEPIQQKNDDDHKDN